MGNLIVFLAFFFQRFSLALFVRFSSNIFDSVIDSIVNAFSLETCFFFLVVFLIFFSDLFSFKDSYPSRKGFPLCTSIHYSDEDQEKKYKTERTRKKKTLANVNPNFILNMDFFVKRHVYGEATHVPPERRGLQVRSGK